MKRWRDTFLRGFWWKLGGALALLLLSYAIPGKAFAQYQNCTNATQPTADCPTAYSAASALAAHIAQTAPGGPTGTRWCGPYLVTQSRTGWDEFQARSVAPANACAPDAPYWNIGKRFFPENAYGCPEGQEWNAEQGKCVASNNCASKPARTNVLAFKTSSSGAVCMDGCFYSPENETNPTGAFQLSFPGASGSAYEAAKKWNATGASCAQPDENKPYNPEKEVCTSLGTLTQCVKPDGSFCATASTGKRLCWQNGETGQKNTQDGTLAGDRQKAPAIPNVTGIDGGTSNPSSNTVNNVTYNQDIKTGGTTSGPSQSNTGDGGSEGGDEGDEGDKGSASGGGSCAAPPSCSGDAINCAVLDQQWRTRCAGDANDDGQPDWTEGDKPTGEGEGSDGDVGEGAYKRFGLSLGTDRLDTDNIFGGGSCPTFSMEVMGFSASTADIPAWCDIAAIMRAVVLIMGAYIALQILLGRI